MKLKLCSTAADDGKMRQIVRLMEFWRVSINKKMYDMGSGSISKHTGHYVLVSRGLLNNWTRLTRTFLEICPRKDYATRQMSSWPVLHNLLALFPLTCFVLPFWKWKVLMEVNKTACESVRVCVCVCIIVLATQWVPKYSFYQQRGHFEEVKTFWLTSPKALRHGFNVGVTIRFR